MMSTAQDTGATFTRSKRTDVSILHSQSENNIPISGVARVARGEEPGIPPLLGWHRKSYTGSLLRNLLSNLLPSLYVVLSRLWIARLDPKYVALASTYTYVGSVAQALESGFPRAGWRLIADGSTQTMQQRCRLASVLTAVLAALAALLLVVLQIATPQLAATYVPEPIRSRSYTYVRLVAGSTFCNIITATLSICTRALDEPDIPLLVQIVSFLVNMALDMLLISPFRVLRVTPNIELQAIIKLCCDSSSMLVGLAMFSRMMYRKNGATFGPDFWCLPRIWQDLRCLWKIGWPLQFEVIPRLVLQLWLSAQIVSLGPEFASAWAVFTTIRVGVFFAPLIAVEDSCNTFVGHAFGLVNQAQRNTGHATRQTIHLMIRPFILSAVLVTVLEVIMYVTFSLEPGRQLASWLANSEDIAELAVSMWQKLDWGFMFLGIFFQTSSIILIAKPTWYLYQSLLAYICFNLPILVSANTSMTRDGPHWLYLILATAATYAFQLVTNLVVTALWTWKQSSSG